MLRLRPRTRLHRSSPNSHEPTLNGLTEPPPGWILTSFLIGLRPMVIWSGWSLGRLVGFDARTLDAPTHGLAEGATHPGGITHTVNGRKRWFLTDFSERRRHGFVPGVLFVRVVQFVVRRNDFGFGFPTFNLRLSTFNFCYGCENDVRSHLFFLIRRFIFAQFRMNLFLSRRGQRVVVWGLHQNVRSV